MPSRAYHWQLKQKGLGNCLWCGEPAGGFSRCEKHRAWFREYSKSYREKDIEKSRAVDRAKANRLRAKDPEAARTKARAKYARNLELMRKQARDRRDANIEAARERDRGRQSKRLPQIRERRRTDPQFRLRQALSNRIWCAVKRMGTGKCAKTAQLVGCSIENLIIYLESRFEPGMTLDNYGRVWHVDHIMPCAVFDLTEPSHQRTCFHFSNLQPLFAEDNLRKHAHAPKVHQFHLL